MKRFPLIFVALSTLLLSGCVTTRYPHLMYDAYGVPWIVYPSPDPAVQAAEADAQIAEAELRRERRIRDADERRERAQAALERLRDRP